MRVQIHLEYAKQFQLALSGKTDGISQKEVRRLNTPTTVSGMSWGWRLSNKVNMCYILDCVGVIRCPRSFWELSSGTNMVLVASAHG